MATYRIRSTDGNNADNGSTWALAKADLAGFAAVDATGDIALLSSVHSEVTASALTINLAGTTAAPVFVLSVNDASENPTATTPGATIATSGANAITVNGNAHWDGQTWKPGNESANNASITFAGDGYFRNQKIYMGTSSSPDINFNSANSGDNVWQRWENLEVGFGHANQTIILFGGRFEIVGLALKSGGISPTNLFDAMNASGENSVLIALGLDLSNAAAGINLVAGSVGVVTGASVEMTFWVSKLPDSWSGGLVNGAVFPGARISMYCSDSADTNNRMWIETYPGSIKSETTLVMTGGAQDNGATISWKMVSNSTCNEAINALITDWIVVENTATGSAKTLTVEILHDSATNMTDAEIALEVMAMTTSGRPLATHYHDGRVDVLATAADQTDSSATWTTTGMTNPNTQKLSVTLTPQEAGLIYCRVLLMKASKTVYINPAVAIT